MVLLPRSLQGSTALARCNARSPRLSIIWKRDTIKGKASYPVKGTRRKTLVATWLARMSPATTDQALADARLETPYLRGTLWKPAHGQADPTALANLGDNWSYSGRRTLPLVRDHTTRLLFE